MGSLFNFRWEAVARGIADGKTQAQAYLDAGYATQPQNAARLACKLLKCHPEILVRTEELKRQIVKREQKASDMALEALAIDREYVLTGARETLEVALGRKKLRKTRVLSRAIGEGPDAEVEIRTADYDSYAYDGAVAARMIEMMGRNLGMFVPAPRDKPDPLDEVPPEMLAPMVEALKEIHRQRVAEVSASASPSPPADLGDK
jgi:hypothetical protein